jgi:monoamine oxidase
MDKHTRIAIIGAGIAGLNAALILQDAGLACSMYEASSRIGGRMHSDTTTWADGMVSEWCGEFIDGNHRTLLHLIERFKLKTIDLGRKIPNRAQAILYFFNRYYDAEEVWGSLQPIYPTLQQQIQ